MAILLEHREVNTREAAARCHFSLNYFRELLRRGEGPPILQISKRKTYFRVDDLENWLLSRRIGA